MTTSPVSAVRPVAHAIVEALVEGGVEYVLGMPGGNTGSVWSAMHGDDRIRAVQAREESIASYMAEAFGRVSAAPVVVMGQGEWIAGNAGQGFLEAHLGCSPMVILTEMTDGGKLSHHAPYQAGTGDYGTWDAKVALAGMCKRVMVAHHPHQAVQLVQLALKHAVTGEPGPVAVVWHSDALVGDVDPDQTPRIYPTSGYLPAASAAVDAGAVADVAALLAEATNPVVVAGNGVRLAGATDELARFADVLEIPVATSASGKGVFDERSASAAGVVGTFGTAAANALVGGADLVLAVGTKLGPHDTVHEHQALLDPGRQTIVQIDIEPLNAGWTFPADRVLIGDAGVQLRALRAAAGPSGSRQPAAARVAALAHLAPRDHPGFADDTVPFDPRRVVTLLEEAFPTEGIVTTDAGENRLFMMHWYRSGGGGRYLQPAAGGGMGYAVPAAMGAKLARPDLPVLAVCGDGGFAMSLHALMTAVQERLPIGVVVFNNGALGWVLHGMGERAVAAHFATFDHEAIATSLGCGAVTVTSSDDLRKAVESIATIERPLVIDVPLSLATSFRDVAQSL